MQLHIVHVLQMYHEESPRSYQAFCLALQKVLHTTVNILTMKMQIYPRPISYYSLAVILAAKTLKKSCIF